MGVLHLLSVQMGWGAVFWCILVFGGFVLAKTARNAARFSFWFFSVDVAFLLRVFSELRVF